MHGVGPVRLLQRQLQAAAVEGVAPAVHPVGEGDQHLPAGGLGHAVGGKALQDAEPAHLERAQGRADLGDHRADAATAQLKGDEATRSIPVIALTALAMKGDEERIRAAGCDGYIGKPMRYKDLLATITAQLGS